MKSFILAIAMTASAQANTTFFDIECSNPGLHYINAFSFSGTIEAEKTQGKWKVYGFTPQVTIRKAGFSSTEETVKLPWTRGEAQKIDTNLTKSPFYNFKLLSADKKTFVNFNVNYPNALSSFIRLEDGSQYKATCKMAAQKTCQLGSTLFDTLELENISVTEVGVVEEYLESFEEIVPMKKKKITFKDSGKVIFALYTFQDEVDGGNTYGKFVDENGKIVATIGDGDVYDCNLFN